MRFATTCGSAMYMSREIQACVSTAFPCLSCTLNAAIAPYTTWPCSTSALNCRCFGPQNGVNTQRVPLDSSHVARAPQTPIVKFTSSLQRSGVRYAGVRWSSAPSELVSSIQSRHSLLDDTRYSLPWNSKIGDEALKSRSRLRIQYAFDGAYQSLNSSALVCVFCFTPIIACP